MSDEIAQPQEQLPSQLQAAQDQTEVQRGVKVLPARGSVERSAEPESRSEAGRPMEEDRDELEDEGDDGASTSTDRARSPEPSTSTVPAAAEGEAGNAGDLVMRNLPQPPGSKTQAAFVHKLYSMLETPSLQHLISWSEDGKSFIIFHPSEFARIVLPQYFKHSNFSSFIRQGNFYHFSKISDVPGSGVPTRSSHTNADGTPVQTWEFRNPNFQRGRPDLLARIKRKTAKSSANASPGLKRRSSTTATTPVLPPRGSRRGSVVSADQDYEPESERGREREQDGHERPIVGGLAAGAMAANGLTRPSTRGEYTLPAERPAPLKRVNTAHSDFGSSYAMDDPRRVKDEPFDSAATTARSPPSFGRQVPPSATSSYPPGNPAYSPDARTPFGIFPPPHHSAGRHPQHDDTTSRQIVTLEAQVHSLTEGFYRSQHDLAVYRTASYGVLHSLLGLVASLDPEGRKKDEVDACSFALAKLSPDVSPTQHHPSAFAYPPPYGASPWGAPLAGSFPFAPPPGSMPHSPRPTTASHQFYYHHNRVPVAESYTRSSRDGVPSQQQHQPSHSQAHPIPPPTPSTATGVPVHPFPSNGHSHPHGNGHSSSGTPVTTDSSNSCSRAGGGHPPPPPLSSTASSSILPPISRPSSSGPHASSSTGNGNPFSHSAQSGYPSPRLSWASNGLSRPPTAGDQLPGSGGAQRPVSRHSHSTTTSLPPLSSLLNPAGGPPPSFPSGPGLRSVDGRSLNGSVAEEEERARKKLRQ